MLTLIFQISDSFILSAPCDKPDYPALIAVSIKAIQISHALLNMGLLVRGGIAVGKAYCTDVNIFGSAYLDAYEAKQKTAITPRILRHKSAEEELKRFVSENRT